MIGPLPLPGNPYSVSVELSTPGGNGTAVIGPTRVREHWQVTGIGVSVATNVQEAQCSVYIGGSPDSATFLGTTAHGSTGDTCSVAGMDIQPGQSCWAVWTGGDAGSTATMTIFGTYTIGSQDL